MEIKIRPLSAEDRKITCQKKFCVNCSEFRVLREILPNYKEVMWLCRSCAVDETKNFLKNAEKTPTCELTGT